MKLILFTYRSLLLQRFSVAGSLIQHYPPIRNLRAKKKPRKRLSMRSDPRAKTSLEQILGTRPNLNQARINCSRRCASQSPNISPITDYGKSFNVPQIEQTKSLALAYKYVNTKVIYTASFAIVMSLLALHSQTSVTFREPGHGYTGLPQTYREMKIF